MASFLQADLSAFLNAYPNFELLSENGNEVLIGDLAIIDKGGKVWDVYRIKIQANSNYPYRRFPKLFELSGKFPKIADWHVYLDESCCITVLPKENIACKKGINLVKYIQEWVIPYFANQTFRMEEGYYKNGEFGHDLFGTYEYYASLLKTNNPQNIIFILDYSLRVKKIQRTVICFCGSKKKYRKCHKDAMEEIWEIDQDIITKHIAEFLQYPLK